MVDIELLLFTIIIVIIFMKLTLIRVNKRLLALEKIAFKARMLEELREEKS